MKVVFGKYEEIDIKNYESMQCEAVKSSSRSKMLPPQM